MESDVLVYRERIEFAEEFPFKYQGGRKIARAATVAERLYLIRLNNRILRLEGEMADICATLIDLREREKNIDFFIRERKEVDNEL